MREGVVHDIHKRLENPILVDRNGKVLGRMRGEGHLLCRRLGLDRLCDEAEQRGDGDLLASQDFGSGFGPRQHEEVSHHPGQAAHRLLQGVQDAPVLLVVPRSSECDFDLPLEHCQRCPQFVCSVCGELPFAVEGLLKPIQHLIEGIGQSVQFIVRPLQPQPLVEDARGDGARGARNSIDRMQDRTGQQPPTNQCGGHPKQRTGGEHDPQTSERDVHLCKAASGHDCAEETTVARDWAGVCEDRPDAGEVPCRGDLGTRRVLGGGERRAAQRRRLAHQPSTGIVDFQEHPAGD